ncbi:oligosaccharide flippase family protein, partial [Providencia stuartii]
MSKNKQELVKNIINFGFIDIMGMIIPIISMPILTRAIGAEQYGQYILFLSILIFGHTFIDYGIQYIGVRDIAKRRYSDISVKYIYEKYQGVRFLFLFLYSI